MIIDKQGYVCRGQVYNAKSKKCTHRNWFLVKHRSNGTKKPAIDIQRIILPEHLIGKKVRFKIEVIS